VGGTILLVRETWNPVRVGFGLDFWFWFRIGLVGEKIVCASSIPLELVKPDV
jgi:hypothetical protein